MPGFDLSQMNSGLLSSQCHAEGAPQAYGNHQRPTNTVETARRYRYLFEILEPLDKESLLVYAYKSTRPSVEIDQITIHNGQDEIYRPGKSRWRPIEITFYERLFGESGMGNKTLDVHGGYNQTAELIYKWWSETMINIQQSLHSPPSSYRKPAQLTMLDGMGYTIWSYYLANCWPMQVAPCDLSYTDTEIADITVTLSYDKAIEKREF